MSHAFAAEFHAITNADTPEEALALGTGTLLTGYIHEIIGTGAFDGLTKENRSIPRTKEVFIIAWEVARGGKEIFAEVTAENVDYDRFDIAPDLRDEITITIDGKVISTLIPKVGKDYDEHLAAHGFRNYTWTK